MFCVPFSMDRLSLLATMYLLTVQPVKCEPYFVNMTVYSAAEKQALNQLRTKAKNLFYLDYHSEDKFLINWLRNRELNVEKTQKALEANFKFRIENGIDRIIEENAMIEFRKSFPTAIGEANDKTGRSPAWELIISKWDIRKAVITGKRAQLDRFIIYVMESISNVTRSVGGSQFILLSDMNNFSARKHGCIACIPFFLQAVKCYENHYGNAKVAVLINVPRVYETINKLIFPIFSPETRKIYKLFGSDKTEWQNFILKLFTADQLTSQFGGTKTIKPSKIVHV